MTDKWNMIVDVALCENCQNCVLSNKDEHVDQAFPGYAAPMPKLGADWIRITRRVRGEGHHVDTSYLVTMCNHCDNAPCVAAGKGAVRQRPDGIVVIDPVASKGRKDLVDVDTELLGDVDAERHHEHSVVGERGDDVVAAVDRRDDARTAEPERVNRTVAAVGRDADRAVALAHHASLYDAP